MRGVSIHTERMLFNFRIDVADVFTVTRGMFRTAYTITRLLSSITHRRKGSIGKLKT